MESRWSFNCYVCTLSTNVQIKWLCRNPIERMSQTIILQQWKLYAMSFSFPENNARLCQQIFSFPMYSDGSMNCAALYVLPGAVSCNVLATLQSSLGELKSISPARGEEWGKRVEWPDNCWEQKMLRRKWKTDFPPAFPNFQSSEKSNFSYFSLSNFRCEFHFCGKLFPVFIAQGTNF